MVTIGSRLKLLRQQKGWSQTETAEKLRISRQSVSKWELDKSLPDIGMLKELALLYDFSLDELLQLQEEKIMLLKALETETMAADSSRLICRNKEPNTEQLAFLTTAMFEPIAARILPERILWQTVLPQIPAGMGSNLSAVTVVSKERTRRYQTLFGGDNGIYLFVTESGLWRTTAVEWLETEKLEQLPFSELAVLVTAPFFEARVSRGNRPGLFYGKKDGGYDMLAIGKPASAALQPILEVLDQKWQIYREYQGYSIGEIVKRWRKQKRLPEE